MAVTSSSSVISGSEGSDGGGAEKVQGHLGSNA